MVNRPRGLPDEWHWRQEQLRRQARLDRASRVPSAVFQDRAEAVQSAALSAGWNTLVTAEVTWPAWASSAIVQVRGSISLVEAASAPDVWGGALKIVTNGVESLETRCFGVYDHRDGGSDNTIGQVSDTLLVETPSASVTADLEFYPWNEGWYLGDPDSTAACHLFVTFLR